MAIDRRNLKVLANFCSAAADAMAFTLMRTAHSAFVKETEDFSCQIVTREGLAFANPRQFGAPWYSGIDYGPLLEAFKDYEEGDICITNDPYSGFVATHSPDIHIWKPVFFEGEIACFVVGHIHNTDVGGAVPASLSRSLSEIEQEGLRLLYVALTRARDRLTLCGYAGKKTPKGVAFDPWYDLLCHAFDKLEHSLEAIPLKAPFDDLEQANTAVIRLYGQRSATLTAEAAITPPEVILPDFVTRIVAQAEVDLERGRERWAAISQMGDEDREDEERAPSPLESQNGLGRYRRGNLIHKLFEILPDIAPKKREEVAARYLDRQPDLNAGQRREMAGAVMSVLNDSRFAEAFGPDSRPEVALAGSIGKSARGDAIMLSGRIDRLVVTQDRVVIIDYKSNRPAPDQAEDAAIAYQRQMAGYVALLRQIYPQKTVEAALLWTDGPKLTPLSEALVNLRLDEILVR